MQQASILRNLLGSINALCIPQSNWSSNFKIGFKVLRYRSKYRNITKFVCSMFVFEKLDDCFKIELTRTGTDGISYSFYSPNNVEIVIFKMFSKKEEEFWSYRDCIYIYIYNVSIFLCTSRRVYSDSGAVVLCILKCMHDILKWSSSMWQIHYGVFCNMHLLKIIFDAKVVTLMTRGRIWHMIASKSDHDQY